MIRVLRDGLLGDVVEHLGSSVFAALDLEQGRGLVNELGVTLARAEGLILQNVGDKGDVGLDTADMDLTDRAQRLGADTVKGGIPGCHLDQQGIIIRRNNGACTGCGFIHTDTETAGDTVTGNTACIRSKVVGGIFCRNTALDGKTVLVYILLGIDTDHGIRQRPAFRDQDLGTDKVDAGDHFRDRMLDLDTGIHLDEIVITGLVYQEFQCAGVGIADMFCDLDGILQNGVTYFRGNRESGRELDDLLIAALQGAVTLIQMGHIAAFICQDLDLDVFGIDQELLHKDIGVTEGLQGFGSYQLKIDADLFYGITAAHTASAAAGRRLQDDREAEFHGQLLGFFLALERFRCTGSSGNIAFQSHLLGAELIAHHIQDPGRRSDEFDAGMLAGFGKLTVLRKEAISGMNGVAVMHPGQFDDPGNVKIRAQGAFIFTDQIGFICGGPESAVGVFVGVDRDCGESQVMAGPENTHGDFSAVGHQDLFEIFAHKLPPVFVCFCGFLSPNTDI